MDTKKLKGLRIARLDRVVEAMNAMKQAPAPKPPLVQRFLPTI